MQNRTIAYDEYPGKKRFSDYGFLVLFHWTVQYGRVREQVHDPGFVIPINAKFG